MRYFKMIAAGTLLAGVVAANAQMGATSPEWTISAGGATAAGNMADYHMGYGASAAVAAERQFGDMADTRFGLRGNFLNYNSEADFPGEDNFQQYSIGLEALTGPAGAAFEPKVGGHVGYVRLDGEGLTGNENNLDVGADVMATFKLTPTVDLQALVSPTWLVGDDDTDYITTGSVSVQLSLPGA
jgi:hypothetical protein